ncbi:MAG: alpha/beta hydrolase-fold protein [Pirellulales bacterium]
MPLGKSFRRMLAWVLLACLLAAGSAPRLTHAVEFDVTLSPDAAQQAVGGRLFVMLSTKDSGEPRFGPNWFNPEPFAGLNIKGCQPGGTVRVDDAADGFPGPLSELAPGKYRVQAVLDHDIYSQHPARGVGNYYSQVVEFEQPEEAAGNGPLVALLLDQTVAAQPFEEGQYVREVEFISKLLSDFYGREFVDRCGVVLPKGYDDDPQRSYPVIYSIPGFSGTHRDALRYADGPPEPGEGETEFIRVMLSGNCKQGHHVFADSPTNGPRGQSLISELIPLIDQRFRTVAQPTARFVMGHSSGGWASLWVQVAYPETFGGVWSLSPDPVDFRDWQQVDLYASPPQSVFTDADGQRRPIARRGETPVLWYDAFCKMDDALGRGGQLRSFEAVFSPLGDDGQPLRAWDRVTGTVHPDVIKAWEAYDIRLKLERNWPRLGPRLAGKLHIITGELDTFYLEGAVRQLAGTLKELGSDAEIEILPGQDHGSLLTPQLYSRIRREMTTAYREKHGE